MKVQAGSVTALNPDYVDVTGPGYHIQIEEIEPGVLLVTSLTDDCRNQLVVRPKSCHEVLISRNLIMLSDEPKPVARPHRHLDATALDVWLKRRYHSLYVHWQTREADRMDLWELIHDHHKVVWKEFELCVQRNLLEGGGQDEET